MFLSLQLYEKIGFYACYLSVIQYGSRERIGFPQKKLFIYLNIIEGYWDDWMNEENEQCYSAHNISLTIARLI